MGGKKDKKKKGWVVSTLKYGVGTFREAGWPFRRLRLGDGRGGKRKAKVKRREWWK